MLGRLGTTLTTNPFTLNNHSSSTNFRAHRKTHFHILMRAFPAPSTFAESEKLTRSESDIIEMNITHLTNDTNHIPTMHIPTP